MNSRVGKVTCKGCGCSLEVPNMYSEKSRKVLQPYCPSTVMLHIQWLLHHGWHITKHEANPLMEHSFVLIVSQMDNLSINNSMSLTLG